MVRQEGSLGSVGAGKLERLDRRTSQDQQDGSGNPWMQNTRFVAPISWLISQSVSDGANTVVGTNTKKNEVAYVLRSGFLSCKVREPVLNLRRILLFIRVTYRQLRNGKEREIPASERKNARAIGVLRRIATRDQARACPSTSQRQEPCPRLATAGC